METVNWLFVSISFSRRRHRLVNDYSKTEKKVYHFVTPLIRVGNCINIKFMWRMICRIEGSYREQSSSTPLRHTKRLSMIVVDVFEERSLIHLFQYVADLASGIHLFCFCEKSRVSERWGIL